MTNRPVFHLALVFLLAATGTRGVSEQLASVALEPIFNGRDLSGWQPEESPFWRVEEGVLVGENDAALTGSMLRTEA